MLLWGVHCNWTQQNENSSFRKLGENHWNISLRRSHSHISYLKHRIPCSCLDEIYKQVKATEKMGLCFNISHHFGNFNTDCRQPRGMVERSKLMCCSRCRTVNYCCQECQEADWLIRHQIICGYDASFEILSEMHLGVCNELIYFEAQHTR